MRILKIKLTMTVMSALFAIGFFMPNGFAGPLIRIYPGIDQEFQPRTFNPAVVAALENHAVSETVLFEERLRETYREAPLLVCVRNNCPEDEWVARLSTIFAAHLHELKQGQTDPFLNEIRSLLPILVPPCFATSGVSPERVYVNLSDWREVSDWILTLATDLLKAILASNIAKADSDAKLDTMNNIPEAALSCEEKLQSSEAKGKQAAETAQMLEARLKSMTDYAASLQLQLQQADDAHAACLRGERKTEENDTNRTICNVLVGFLGAPQQNTLCEAIGRTH